MVTQQQIQGGWNELKGMAKQKWGQLMDDDLSSFEGTTDEFVGMLQQKTGEAKSAIRSWLDTARREAEPMIDRVAEVASNYAGAAADAASHAVGRVRETLATGHGEVDRTIRRNPTESVAVAFAAGLIAGLIVALTTRGRS